jgi:hypothetical protein
VKFPAAVRASGLEDAFKAGIRAMGGDRSKVTGGRGLAGSVNLDAALRVAQPNAARWDYLVGLMVDARHDRMFCIEVHPADVGEVDAILAKKKWLDETLAGTDLAKLPRRNYWIATPSGVHFNGNVPQLRRLASAGIEPPIKHLKLS